LWICCNPQSSTNRNKWNLSFSQQKPDETLITGRRLQRPIVLFRFYCLVLQLQMLQTFRRSVYPIIPC